MANEEQLSILKQGVEVWNKWREKNPDLNVDLSNADLRETELSEANFVGANLERVHLFRANLRKANLSQSYLLSAHLEQADLTQANLSNSGLHGANLEFANLTQADLRDARLYGTYVVERGVSSGRASLEFATLRQADLSRASLDGASLLDCDLYEAILQEAELDKANLHGANLSGANLIKTSLKKADLSNANVDNVDLTGANLMQANLCEASLVRSNLRGANLFGADLMAANISESDLTGATLANANLVSTKIARAKVSGSWVYSANVWDLEGEFEEQRDLIITAKGEPIITVDNIKIAQFIYLILNNEEIREVINTLTSKSVLILGRFALPERKAILDALRNKLREYNLLPVVFDFDHPTDKDFTETIKTLAGLSYFVIADITNPKSSPLELQATVPDYQIPFVPIIQEGERPFAMMVDLQKKYNWVLDTISYDSMDTLIKALKPAIIDPAIQKHNELRLVKAQKPKIRSASDFIDDKGLDNQSA